LGISAAEGILISEMNLSRILHWQYCSELITLAAGVSLIVLSACTSPLARVELVNGETGEVVWESPANIGQHVELAYEHSLYRAPQIEVYRLSYDGLVLDRMAFGSYDAVMYYDPDPATLPHHDGTYWQLPMPEERRIPPAPFRVGFTTNHRLRCGSHEVDVATVIPAGGLAILRAPVKFFPR
jgi:hypothetical protein